MNELNIIKFPGGYVFPLEGCRSKNIQFSSFPITFHKHITEGTITSDDSPKLFIELAEDSSQSPLVSEEQSYLVSSKKTVTFADQYNLSEHTELINDDTQEHPTVNFVQSPEPIPAVEDEEIVTKSGMMLSSDQDEGAEILTEPPSEPEDTITLDIHELILFRIQSWKFNGQLRLLSDSHSDSNDKRKK